MKILNAFISLKNQSYIGLFYLTIWLVLNTACNFINRILFHHIAFHFPVLFTASHSISSIVLYLFVTKVSFIILILKYHSYIYYNNNNNLMVKVMKWDKFETVTLSYFMKYILPVGIFGCVTTILNNLGLDFIDVATVQIIKSTTPLFTVLFAYIFMDKVSQLLFE